MISYRTGPEIRNVEIEPRLSLVISSPLSSTGHYVEIHRWVVFLTTIFLLLVKNESLFPSEMFLTYGRARAVFDVVMMTSYRPPLRV